MPITVGPEAMSHDLRTALSPLKSRLYPGLLIALVCWLGFGCGAPTSPRMPAPEPLIQNGTFESAGAPTFAGWRIGNPDLASLVDADWAPTLGVAYVSVPGVRPGDRLRLSALVRALTPDGGGTIKILTGRSLSYTRQLCGAGTSDTGWTALSVEAVASADPADSLWVVLSSPHTQVTARSGLFDGVELIRLPSVATGAN